MRPSVIAHRGASGYEHQNSRAAFRRAVELGADGIELDIHATTDNVLVVHHDAGVPGVGILAQLPFSAFADYRLPNGETLPTLEEVLPLVEGLDVWVEVKTLPRSADSALLQILDRGPTPGRYAVHGFDHRIVARLGDRRPELRRGVLLASYPLDALPVLRGPGADTLWMETHLVDRDLVQQLHEDGASLIAWTANEEAEVRRLAALGVDGICGNYPDRIRAVLT